MTETQHRLQQAWHWYFAPGQDGQSVILWWENRRFAYNLILLSLAIAIYLAVATAGGIIKHHFLVSYTTVGYFVVLVQLITQICANVWYTGGWIVELIVKNFASKHFPRFGPVALLSGTAFSILFDGATLLFFSIVAAKAL